ncbi:glycosyltransferase family 4 protein [Candidatus Pelagibacter sp.]|uniref:glycosyltransferase family 4 protein n=1 Tax=Candidatus Pelagibacter sp. TaxID=2024849 RepID=UPI003F875EB5
MNILIEGWRGINHSFSLVNQWQIIEFAKTCNLFFKDVPFVSDGWNVKTNYSGFKKELLELVENIPYPEKSQSLDITYRLSFPFDFNADFSSKILVVFATCEYKFLNKQNYINGIPEILNDNKKFFIHTPTNWCKEGLLKAGFKEDQIIVEPHGVNKEAFNTIFSEEAINIRKKYNIRNDSFVLTNIGAMTKNKGVEILIAAYGVLKKKIKNLQLILKDQSNLYGIKGENIFEKVRNSSFNKKYKIINEKMMSDITIVSQNLDLNDLKNLYQITDCYVSPYLAEGFNLTPLEAAACGTQILITKGGCTDDYYAPCLGYQIDSNERKEEEAHFIEPKIDSLINILQEKIINKTDNLKTERSNYIHKKYSWDIVVNNLKKEFESKIK